MGVLSLGAFILCGFCPRELLSMGFLSWGVLSYTRATCTDLNTDTCIKELRLFRNLFNLDQNKISTSLLDYEYVFEVSMKFVH